MAKYPWPLPGEGATAEEILAYESQTALPGIKSYSLQARRDALLAELAYTYGAGVPNIENVYNVVTSYGAKGNGIADDTTAIQAAITACAANGGGKVYLPPGTYKTTATLQIPVEQFVTIKFAGAGIRATYISPVLNNATAILVGNATPDPSGTSTYQTRYHTLEGFDLNGSSCTGTCTGIHMTEPQFCTARDVIIEAFSTGASSGLYLQGSTTVGINANPSAPHAWRNSFYNVLVATTMRPLVLDNADENDFYHCNFALPTGLVGTNACVELIQGRNNRFFGLLLSGDSTSGSPPASNYVGFLVGACTKGNVAGLFVSGVVAEGFECGFYFTDSYWQDAWITNYDSSINTYAFYNGSYDGATDNERQNNVHIYLNGSSKGTVRDYHTGPAPEPESLSVTDGDTSPSVRATNSLRCSNSNPTTITTFDDGRDGQTITVRLDAKTTLQHGLSTGNICCPNGINVVGATNMVVRLVSLGGLWYVLPGTAAITPATIYLYGDANSSNQAAYVALSFANQSVVDLRRWDGTVSSPTHVGGAEAIGMMRATGHDGTSSSATGAYIQAVAVGDWSNTSHGTRFDIYTTASGSTTNTKAMTIGADQSLGLTAAFGANGATPQAKINLTGSKGGNAALAAVVALLVSYGFATDGTT